MSISMWLRELQKILGGGESLRVGWGEERTKKGQQKTLFLCFLKRRVVMCKKHTPSLRAKRERCVQNNNININSGRSFQLTQNAVSVASYRLINTFVALVMNKRGKRKLES